MTPVHIQHSLHLPGSFVFFTSALTTIPSISKHTHMHRYTHALQTLSQYHSPSTLHPGHICKLLLLLNHQILNCSLYEKYILVCFFKQEQMRPLHTLTPQLNLGYNDVGLPPAH